MREKLIQYVNLLFAGVPGSDDIRDEILQNTLDRFDDLIFQGKSPEAAYSLAISGIGDINEILNNTISPASASSPAPNPSEISETEDPRTQSDLLDRNERGCPLGQGRPQQLGPGSRHPRRTCSGTV